MDIYAKFYDDQSPNMVMSREPDLNFKNVHFLPNSILNVRKSYQIWGKVAEEQKSYRQKTKLGVENTPLPSAYRVKRSCVYNLKFRKRNNLVFVQFFYVLEQVSGVTLCEKIELLPMAPERVSEKILNF